MKWFVEIKDNTTDLYITSGSFSLEELLSWEEEGFRIEFSDKNSAKIYEQHKRLYKEGAI